MGYKGYTVGTYIIKTEKKKSDLPICHICKKCRDKSVCNNRKNKKEMSKCEKCRKCNNSLKCDKFYINQQHKATLTISKNPNTGAIIRKTFTGRTEEEALNKMYKYKFETKELEKSNILTKTENTIVNIAQEIEDYKYKIGKTKANSYITNIATLERIKKYEFANISIDGYVSLLVSIFILVTGYKAIKEIIDLLLGQKPDSEFVKQIEEFAKKYETIEGIHDIMVHDYGPGRKIVSFHAEVPANSDICKCHDIIDQIEQDMFEKFQCITTIHMDPIVVDDEEINEMRKFTEDIVKNINKEFSIHDFRMTDGGERVNLIFDLVIPTDEKININETINKIQKEIHSKNQKYYAVIKAEYSYV